MVIAQTRSESMNVCVELNSWSVRDCRSLQYNTAIIRGEAAFTRQYSSQYHDGAKLPGRTWRVPREILLLRLRSRLMANHPTRLQSNEFRLAVQPATVYAALDGRRQQQTGVKYVGAVVKCTFNNLFSCSSSGLDRPGSGSGQRILRLLEGSISSRGSNSAMMEMGFE